MSFFRTIEEDYLQEGKRIIKCVYSHVYKHIYMVHVIYLGLFTYITCLYAYIYMHIIIMPIYSALYYMLNILHTLY